MFYRLLSADTVEEQETIKAELSGLGLNLSRSAEEIIKTADYNQTCKAIARVSGDWSVDLIEARSKRIAELAWDKLAPLLGIA
jgi:dihydroneopterin aldolase